MVLLVQSLSSMKGSAMHKHTPTLAFLLLACTACSSAAAPPPTNTPPQELPEMTGPTNTAAVLLPPTWTPTITATHTVSPTVTETPTETPVVTPEPTSEKTEIVQPLTTPGTDLASVNIFIEDLPAGYKEYPVDDSWMGTGFLTEEQGQLLSMAMFTDESETNVVWSMVSLMSTTQEAEEFDEQIDEMMAEFEDMFQPSEGLGGEFVVEMIDGMQDIGNKSAGLRMVMEFGGEAARYDIAVFRRGPVGAMLMYIGSSQTALDPDVVKLARLLDERAIAALQ
jgi:hypothetical protein